MTLDEAIKHCEDVAEQSEYSAIMFKQKKEASAFLEKAEAEKAENDSKQCAADHRQLAEWLRELKQLKEADVQSVKRREWKKIEIAKGIYQYQCNNCGLIEDFRGGFPTNYCSCCGSDMRCKMKIYLNI